MRLELGKIQTSRGDIPVHLRDIEGSTQAYIEEQRLVNKLPQDAKEELIDDARNSGYSYMGKVKGDDREYFIRNYPVVD